MRKPKKKLCSCGIGGAHHRHNRETDEALFQLWCKKAKIAPKSRPISNFDVGSTPSGVEYVLDPHVKVMAGKVELKMNRKQGPFILVRFNKEGAWIGGSMMVWGKNPWEIKR